mgnify:CR=1 FL=1
MPYLNFDLAEGTDGVWTLDAMASTRVAEHDAVRAEAAAARAWARRHFPTGPGPVEDGADWDEDLQVVNEPGGWVTLTLTFSGSDAFAAAFRQAFGDADG